MADYPDLSGLSTYDSKGRKIKPDGIVIHHTAGWPFRRTNPGIIERLNERGLGAHFVMDREGEVARGVPPDAYTEHMRPGGFRMDNPPEAIKRLGNSNMLGLEVSAWDDDDVLPVQVQKALRLISDVGMTQGWDPGKMAWGHGEVNGHKEATEGQKIVTAVRQHHPRTQQEALMSPAPMAQQYAPNFGFWGAPSISSGVSVIPVKTVRERGAFRGAKLEGAYHPREAALDGPWIRDVKRRYDALLNLPRPTQDRLPEPWKGGRTLSERLQLLAASGAQRRRVRN